MSVFRRLLRRPALPEGVVLDADEHVIATAEVAGGGQVLATSRGLWLPGSDGEPELLNWHLISKATWEGGALRVIPSREIETVAGAVLIADEAPLRVRLAEPRRVPETVHRRVTGSIKSRHHRDLPSGGAWFVQRTVAGRDGIVLQVRADPGTDADAVRQVAGEVARRLRLT
ncbi:MAG: hypothetical protein H0X35_01205 [Pseudonocardiales bacterium]|nr:hypothetical protein [Pseudonocardiales bacterium]